MCLDAENQIIYVIGRYLNQDTRTALFTITVPVRKQVTYVYPLINDINLYLRVIFIATVFRLVSGRSSRLILILMEVPD